MNEPAVKMEEQIINLFQEVETEVYEGWVLKTLGSRLIVFPLYNVYPDNMDERIRACERLGNEKSAECGRFVHYGGNSGSVQFVWQN